MAGDHMVLKLVARPIVDYICKYKNWCNTTFPRKLAKLQSECKRFSESAAAANIGDECDYGLDMGKMDMITLCVSFTPYDPETCANKGCPEGCPERKQAKMARCGACKRAWYCSRNCQSKHWKDVHKMECKSIASSEACIIPLSAMSIANILAF